MLPKGATFKIRATRTKATTDTWNTDQGAHPPAVAVLCSSIAAARSLCASETKEKSERAAAIDEQSTATAGG